MVLFLCTCVQCWFFLHDFVFWHEFREERFWITILGKPLLLMCHQLSLRICHQLTRYWRGERSLLVWSSLLMFRFIGCVAFDERYQMQVGQNRILRSLHLFCSRASRWHMFCSRARRCGRKIWSSISPWPKQVLPKTETGSPQSWSRLNGPKLYPSYPTQTSEGLQFVARYVFNITQLQLLISFLCTWVLMKTTHDCWRFLMMWVLTISDVVDIKDVTGENMRMTTHVYTESRKRHAPGLCSMLTFFSIFHFLGGEPCGRHRRLVIIVQGCSSNPHWRRLWPAEYPHPVPGE